MALPAKIVDPQVDFARQQLVRYLTCMSNPWSDDPLMSGEAGQALARFTIKQFMSLSPIGLICVMRAARDGDQDCREVLRHLLVEYKSCGIPLPPELQGYDAELTAFGPGDARRGTKRARQMLRDICIMIVVADVMKEFGLPATGRSVRKRSACEVVSEALSRLGRPIGIRGVEKIWDRLRGAWPIWVKPEE
jgi:hypothetical protein